MNSGLALKKKSTYDQVAMKQTWQNEKEFVLMKCHYRFSKAWMLRVSLPCFLAVAPSLGFGQPSTDNNAVTVGSVAYSGELSPAELMVEEYQRIMALDPNAKVTFEVSIPVIKNGKVIVQNVDGLPLGKDEFNRYPSEATITVPISTEGFRNQDGFDAAAFKAAVDDQLRHLREPTDPNTSADSSTPQTESDN
jgi:hypothetical protein